MSRLPAGAVAWVSVALGLLGTACASRPPVVLRSSPAVVVPLHTPVLLSQAPLLPNDPISALIERSERHFEAGRRELGLGHLGNAKTEFNLSLEILLESPLGARSEPRIRDHFDELVSRISAYEITSLAEGDGFAEKAYEPASIDELLALSTFDAPPARPELELSVAADLEEMTYDVDIPLNARVLKFVDLFSGRLKGHLQEGLSRGTQYLPMIQEVFRAEGLPLDLAYVPLIESAFKPSAQSRAKAKGIWQFMRGTALENGLKHDWYIDERAEPEKSTRAAARYLKTLYGMFNDWHLALASYNGGPGRVQRAMARSGRKSFWALSASSRYLPRETRDYVPLVLAAIIVARNPAEYGLEVMPADPEPHETLTVASAVDIRRIAEWADAPVRTIQDLNPELRRWTTPVRSTSYELRVPRGSASSVLQRMAEADPNDLAPLKWHTVKKGETLATIAKKLKVSRTDLAEANYLSIRSKVAAGQQLVIPRAPTLLLAAASGHTDSARQPDMVVANAGSPAGPAQTDAPEDEPVVHRVKRGDTLSSIARLYRTSITLIKEWNGIIGTTIRVGQVLTVVDPTSATN